MKVLAAQRETSVSRLLAEQLERLVERDEAYERARERHLAWLESAPDLGTRGKITWTRDELHERRGAGVR